MTTKKRGMQSVVFNSPPVVDSWGSIVGPMEGQGPFGIEFDWIMEDYLFGEQTWEKTESKLLRETLRLAARKIGLQDNQLEVILAGDLLNQVVSSNFAAREIKVPYLGLYGACSTIIEGSILGAMLLDGGFYDRVAAGAVSHHHTAERQYRFPVELGVQRPPSAQWTVTGAGALTMMSSGQGPRLTSATLGKVIDMGQNDANDMGGAMAQAAVDTVVAHFQDLSREADYYDLVVTGDLGQIGTALLLELCAEKGHDLGNRHVDCGIVIYDPQQDVHAGGSGCGCLASMMCGPYLNRIKGGKLNRVLFIGTGALMNPTSMLQGENIPAIAHAVSIEN